MIRRAAEDAEAAVAVLQGQLLAAHRERADAQRALQEARDAAELERSDLQQQVRMLQHCLVRI